MYNDRPFVHPYWQILENSSIFSIFQFWGHELDCITRKLIQKYYKLSSNTAYFMFQNSEIDDWMSFPAKRYSSCPGNCY